MAEKAFMLELFHLVDKSFTFFTDSIFGGYAHIVEKKVQPYRCSGFRACQAYG